MSRIPALDLATATGNVKSNLDAVNKALGATPNMARVMAQAPATLDSFVQQFVATSKSVLNAKTRNAIAIAVAQENGCDYCLSAHTYLGHSLGAGDAKTEAVVKLARALVEKHGEVTADDLGTLSHAEVLDTITVTVLNIFTNYVNKVAETEIDFPIVRAAR